MLRTEDFSLFSSCGLAPQQQSRVTRSRASGSAIYYLGGGYEPSRPRWKTSWYDVNCCCLHKERVIGVELKISSWFTASINWSCLPPFLVKGDRNLEASFLVCMFVCTNEWTKNKHKDVSCPRCIFLWVLLASSCQGGSLSDSKKVTRNDPLRCPPQLLITDQNWKQPKTPSVED